MQDSEKRPVKKRRGPGNRKPKSLPAIVEPLLDLSASTTDVPLDNPTDAPGPSSHQDPILANSRAESQTEEEMDAAAVIQALDPVETDR